MELNRQFIFFPGEVNAIRLVAKLACLLIVDTHLGQQQFRRFAYIRKRSYVSLEHKVISHIADHTPSSVIQVEGKIPDV